MKGTVSERGQVTIPKRLRDELGIAAGQILDFEADGGRLVATKMAPCDPVEAVYGVLGGSLSTDEAIAGLRGEPSSA